MAKFPAISVLVIPIPIWLKFAENLNSGQLFPIFSQKSASNLAFSAENQDFQLKNFVFSAKKLIAWKAMVRVETVDSFQGKESKIVILCTTKSGGGGEVTNYLFISITVNILESRGEAPIYRWAPACHCRRQQGSGRALRVWRLGHVGQVAVLRQDHERVCPPGWLREFLTLGWMRFARIFQNTLLFQMGPSMSKMKEGDALQVRRAINKTLYALEKEKKKLRKEAKEAKAAETAERKKKREKKALKKKVTSSAVEESGPASMEVDLTDLPDLPDDSLEAADVPAEVLEEKEPYVVKDSLQVMHAADVELLEAQVNPGNGVSYPVEQSPNAEESSNDEGEPYTYKNGGERLAARRKEKKDQKNPRSFHSKFS